MIKLSFDMFFVYLCINNNLSMVINEKKNLIAQSRPLVEAKYNFTLWELRLFIDVLQQIKKGDKDLKEYRLYYKDLIKQYGQNNRDYEHIQRAAVTILRKVVHFDYTLNGEERIYHAVLFTAASTPKNWKENGTDKFINFKVNPDLKDQLIQLKKNYLLYDKRNILKLRSKFSVRIYQILKSYERKDRDTVTLTLSVNDLREMLLVDDNGIPTNQYKKYFLFKKNVILKAQEEINEHTDIAFTFEEIKKGRRIESIKFYLYKNRENQDASKPKQLEISELEPLDPIEELELPENPIFVKLTDLGITSDRAYILIGRYGNDELLLSELEFAQKKLESSINVKNPAGFIYNSIENQEFQKSELVRKRKQDNVKNKKQSEKDAIEKHAAKIEELREEYTAKRNEAMEKILQGYTKLKRKQEIDKRLEGQIFLKKAFEKAVVSKKKGDEIDLTCSLFATELESSNLDSFKNYILHQYGYVIKDQGKYEMIMKSK